MKKKKQIMGENETSVEEGMARVSQMLDTLLEVREADLSKKCSFF